ncbi:isotrichodermin C-15 hydroxylase [Xylariaceae sp. AK1471]|nr:isotrichodermin C-15 hydroxylase [Xylariaceae sp. AK1471]
MDISAKPAAGLSALLLLMGTSLGYVLYRAIYNVFFHPLRSYPGPWLRAASRLPYTISIFQGDATHEIKALHDKYGQVVRVAPDSLSYTAAQAWTDVYALRQSNQSGNLPKDPKFYFKSLGNVDSIVSAGDADHRRLRRLQAHAFSEKAVFLQEPYLLKYTKQFVTRLRDEASRNNGVVDIMQWVNFLTTDVIGDLSFGISFGGLDTGKLHPWLETLFTTIKTFTFIREILRLPAPIIKATMACIPKSMIEHYKGSIVFGAQAAQRRMSQTTDRPDFMSYMLKHNEDEGKGMSKAELEMAASIFIIAGSETTATMISGTMYLLLSNPSVLSELTNRIRSDFPEESDLVNVQLQQHEYLNSVLKEGLRLYPPAPDALFRTTKDRSVIVAGKVVPPHTSITMNLWAAYRDPINFHKPLEFIPERWMKETPAEFLNDDKTVFKPFSVGPRDCIGKNLAWAEMRLILAHLVWKIDFLAIEPESRQWIERQKIFSLLEKLPLNVKIAWRDNQAN